MTNLKWRPGDPVDWEHPGELWTGGGLHSFVLETIGARTGQVRHAVLGYLDDLVIIPLGVALAIKMVPPQVLAECREEARGVEDRSVGKVAAVVVVAVWISLAALAVWFAARAF